MKPKINLVAVLVAAIVHFGLGAAWFTVFAQPWIAGLGMTPEQVQAAKASPSPLPYFIAFLCNLVIAYAIGWVLVQLSAQNAIRGIAVGAMVGIAAAAAMFTEHSFELRPVLFKLISAGYPLAGAIIMGAILGVWKKPARTAPSS